jgi:hypothetical protein
LAVDENSYDSRQSDDSIKPRGVLLRDVASLLTDGDPDAAKEVVSRWHRSRNPKRPVMLGKDADNRAGLYALSAILDFVKILEGLTDADISALKRQLHSKVRPVRR